MTRTARSYRWPDITVRQLDELQAITGLNQSYVIRSAVDRMYQQEVTVNAEYEILGRAAVRGAVDRAGSHPGPDAADVADLVEDLAIARGLGEGEEGWTKARWAQYRAQMQRVHHDIETAYAGG